MEINQAMKNTYSSTSNPVHIIMVTWNAIEYTKYALDSLFLYTDLLYVLTVVDNGSSDGTQQYLHSLIPKNNCLISLLSKTLPMSVLQPGVSEVDL